MTVEALKGVDGITSREAERSKNFFALGLMSWLYNRPTDGTLTFIGQKFAKRPEIAEANTRAVRGDELALSEDFAVSATESHRRSRRARTARSRATARSLG